MSSSMWSLQVNSEKFTKYLSKILSVDLQQIVDTKASELMHRHCDIYKPLIKGIRECFNQGEPQFENFNPFKSTYSLQALFCIFLALVCSTIFWMTKILCVVCNKEMAKETKMTL